MNGQVNNYKNTVSQVVDLLGDEDSAANYLSKCIYSLGLGSNDYLNNYFMPDTYSTSRQYTPDQYADVLIQQYSQQIKVSTNLFHVFTVHGLIMSGTFTGCVCMISFFFLILCLNDLPMDLLRRIKFLNE